MQRFVGPYYVKTRRLIHCLPKYSSKPRLKQVEPSCQITETMTIHQTNLGGRGSCPSVEDCTQEWLIDPVAVIITIGSPGGAAP